MGELRQAETLHFIDSVITSRCMSRQSASVRLESADFERLKLVALVDRRSISEIVAECVTRALPALEAELQRPRLSPDMVARLKAGEKLEEIMRSNLAPFAPVQLNEPGTPYAVNSPAPAATAAEAAAAALVAHAAATLGPTPAVAAPSASTSAPAAAGPPRRGGRPKPPVLAPK
jgi:hypothetical protein